MSDNTFPCSRMNTDKMLPKLCIHRQLAKENRGGHKNLPKHEMCVDCADGKKIQEQYPEMVKEVQEFIGNGRRDNTNVTNAVKARESKEFEWFKDAKEPVREKKKMQQEKPKKAKEKSGRAQCNVKNCGKRSCKDGLCYGHWREQHPGQFPYPSMAKKGSLKSPVSSDGERAAQIGNALAVALNSSRQEIGDLAVAFNDAKKSETKGAESQSGQEERREPHKLETGGSIPPSAPNKILKDNGGSLLLPSTKPAGQISDCCGEDVVIESSINGTNYWICSACKRPCNAIVTTEMSRPPSPKDPKTLLFGQLLYVSDLLDGQIDTAHRDGEIDISILVDARKRIGEVITGSLRVV